MSPKTTLPREVPSYQQRIFFPRRKRYCLCIPMINEGEKIRAELRRAAAADVAGDVDIVLCDGGSTDGSLTEELFEQGHVRALLTKLGPGRLSAQLRMGYFWALQEGYEGIVTIDGNNKDNIEGVAAFCRALEEGYDMVQGSRYLPGGRAVNTPLLRHVAVKLLHIPLVSMVAGFRYTDTTNGYRAYSRRYLTDERVQPFRDIFTNYELLAYLSVRAPQLGFKTKELPVERVYPKQGKVPTKISFLRGNIELLKTLLHLLQHRYDPS